MKLFPSRKSQPKRRRRTKKSRRWINRAKAEVRSMPSLSHLAEDPIVKAAILSTACHFTITLEDLRPQGSEEMAAALQVLWAIEALQKRYPRYLQYAKWVAMKQGLNKTERKAKKKSAGYRDKQERAQVMTAPEAVPPPDMGQLMQEEWRRRFAGRAAPVAAPTAGDAGETGNALADFLREIRRTIESQAQYGDQSQNHSVETIPVDVDDKGIIIEMTPRLRDIWNSLTERQPPVEKPPEH